MKVTKIGNHLMFEFEYDGEQLMAISSDESLVDKATIKAMLNKGVIIDPNQETNRKEKFNVQKIKNYFIESGYYFENPEEFYKQCLGCGRKITYKEANESPKICCGSGSYILPNWKNADKFVLKNLRIFKKK